MLATSFITQTAKVFSNEGFDFLGTLSTISQGAGLAFVASGALTDRGKQAVAKTLNTIKVPASLHAEVTFGASLVLLGAAYGINQNSHLVGNWYFDQAQHHEAQGEWSQAFKSYKRALNFAPDDYKTQIAFGFLHEKLGSFDQAVEEYKKGTAFGIPEFLNAQARAMLMGGFQKNSWQGGIDSKIIHEAEDLLERAEKSTLDLSRSLGKTRKNRRLYADIKINQAIAQMAKIKFKEKLDETTKNSLNKIVDRLISINESIKQDQSEEQNVLTATSTLGKTRAECFYQKAFSIGKLSGSSSVNGIDYLVRDDEIFYACSPFRWGAMLSTVPDAFLLRNYQFAKTSTNQEGENLLNTSYFMELIYQIPFANEVGIELPEYANRIILSQDPDTWLSLANQLSKLIQNNYVKGYSKDNKKIIWRFLLNKDGQVIAYFAYDAFSQEMGHAQPFIEKALNKKVLEQLSGELLKGGKLEFVDFKVVLSEEGKILHLLPWEMAYPTVFAKCQEKCKNLFFASHVRSVFPNYKPDLRDLAEIGALQAVLHMNLEFLAIDVNKGAYYEEPAIFKLKVSADGQTVNYEAVNQVAIHRLGKHIPLSDLKVPQFPELQKPPYADLKLETKGLPSRLTPWSESK
ncbi:hypothetical protein [Nostoc foliaceum]|uniref:Uncharacterized protein n=1 Tax=Nostoc foliaceum FACHB-393 TaxID=2692915 RepID=A0ABR8IFN1_9NOSO|nr:hypothetical protein [Nostoc foliaceum]MBD2650401.1 hypothetical protein [Nostoc foliaceum FACHB-393]